MVQEEKKRFPGEVDDTIADPNKNDEFAFHPDVVDLRLQRKRRTVVIGLVGGVVGLLILGPLGGVVGGLAGAFGARAMGRHREERRAKELQLQQSLLSLQSKTQEELQNQQAKNPGAMY